MNTIAKVEGTCGICGDEYTGTMAQMYCYNSTIQTNERQENERISKTSRIANRYRNLCDIFLNPISYGYRVNPYRISDTPHKNK